MSLGDSKAGESWTELDPADDSTYSLPIFLSVGKYSVAVAVSRDGKIIVMRRMKLISDVQYSNNNPARHTQAGCYSSLSPV